MADDDLERHGPNGGNGYIRVPIREVLDGMDRKLDRIEEKVENRLGSHDRRIRRVEGELDRGSFVRRLSSKAITYIVMAVVAGLVALVVGVTKGG